MGGGGGGGGGLNLGVWSMSVANCARPMGGGKIQPREANAAPPLKEILRMCVESQRFFISLWIPQW